MVSQKRFFMTFLAVTVVTSLLMASNIQAQGKNLAAKQVLSISVLAADLKNLDPHFANTTSDRAVVDMIFNGLLRYKPGNYPEIESDLATDVPKPEIVNGKQIWTFHLRKGVMTHPFPGYPNGYELTSEDVVYSLKRSADPDRSAWAGDYPDWIHYEAVDKYTVKFILDKPLSPTLFYPKVVDYAGGFIVPKKAAEAIEKAKFKTSPVGTGPFAVEKYMPKERLILRRHSNYFRGKPILEKVNAVYIANIAAAEMALLENELQAMIGPTEQPWVEKMESTGKDIVVDTFGPGENVVLYYNTKKPPLNSLDVRKAIAYAISRKEMIALFGEKIGTPTYSQVPAELMTGALSREDLEKAEIPWELGPHDIDIERAKALLAKAGYPKGFNLEAYSSERGYYIKPFQLIQAQMKKIGVNLKINLVDHAAYHSLIRKDANHLVFYNAWRANPDVYLTRFFHSSSEVMSGKSPDTNFSHSNMIDELIENARFEGNLVKQVNLWKTAQITLLRNAEMSAFCILKLTCARLGSVDWGHSIKASVALYPQIDETTRILKK